MEISKEERDKYLNPNYWDSFLSEEQKERMERQHRKDEIEIQIFSTKGLKNFRRKFSPCQGFLGLGEEKARSRKDSIEFIARTGLVDNEKEAEEFLDKYKNHSLEMEDHGSFEIIELKNSNQECFYKARIRYDPR
jgi:hypothetical protein